MATLQLGRLLLGAPSGAFTEGIGDPVGNTGGTVVPAPRTPLQIQFDLNTILSGASVIGDAQRIRRGLRSMLNNTPLKMQMHIYVVYADDPEQNGWMVPAPATFTSPDAVAWKAVGLWQTSSGAYNLVGRQRNMREAKSIWLKDLRTGLYERDYLGLVINNDFSFMGALQLTPFPNGALRPVDTVTGLQVLNYPMSAGRDGGACIVVTESLRDLSCVAYERPESAMNLSDVIAYDRRGQITAPAAGPDTSWEESLGPDYPWSWLGAGTDDAVVLDNGQVRVRFDASVGFPGFRIDMWNGASYVEQGKLNFYRSSPVQALSAYNDVWLSAGLPDYTPDRAVASLVLGGSGDQWSYQRIFITMQRGFPFVRFEVYGAPDRFSNVTDVSMTWSPAQTDVNASIVKPNLFTPASYVATAGSGSAAWGSVNMGDFTGGGLACENWMAMLRCSALSTVTAFQTNFVVMQKALVAFAQPDNVGYGVSRNAVAIDGQGGLGYNSVALCFSPTASDQVLEAESFINGVSGTATVVNEAAASGGQAVRDTQNFAAGANTCVKASNLIEAKYRVFVRARSSLTSKIQVALGTQPTNTVSFSSLTYIWVDLGDVLATDVPPFNVKVIAGYDTTPANTFVDRVEMYLVEDRTEVSASTFKGARDQGSRAMTDTRTLGTLTAR